MESPASFCSGCSLAADEIFALPYVVILDARTSEYRCECLVQTDCFNAPHTKASIGILPVLQSLRKFQARTKVSDVQG